MYNKLTLNLYYQPFNNYTNVKEYADGSVEEYSCHFMKVHNIDMCTAINYAFKVLYGCKARFVSGYVRKSDDMGNTTMEFFTVYKERGIEGLSNYNNYMF